MKWIFIPTTVRIPGLNPVVGFWYCLGDGRCAVKRENKIAIVPFNGLLPGVSVDGVHLDVSMNRTYNGRPIYGSIDFAVFFSVAANSWILRKDGPYEPVNAVDPDSGEVTGDAWWIGGASVAGTYFARGTATGEYSVSIHWPRWENSEPSQAEGLTCLGNVYKPQDGAEGTIEIGGPAWRRSLDGTIFLRRSDDSIMAPATGAGIVAASSLNEEDETGDYVFSDMPKLRLRELPLAGRQTTFYTFDGGYYSRAGFLYSVGTHCVPTIPYHPPRPIHIASAPTWI
jgi:hypothetical protein